MFINKLDNNFISRFSYNIIDRFSHPSYKKSFSKCYSNGYTHILRLKYAQMFQKYIEKCFIPLNISFCYDR